MLPRRVSRSALPRLRVARRELIPFLPLALANTTRTVITVAKMGNVKTGYRDADEVLAFAANHLAVGDIFLEIVADFPPHDVTKAIGIT